MRVFMKNIFKTLGIIVLTAIIAVMTGCSTEADGDTRPVLSGTVNIDNTTPEVGDTLTADYTGGNGAGGSLRGIRL